MNVLIVDDHALIREGIALMVKSVQAEADVWQASSYSAGMEIADREHIDLAFLDLELPDESGFTALEKIKKQHEAMSVVVVSAHEDHDTVMQALELGARAFVPKSADTANMKNVVQGLLEGRVFLPDSVLETKGTGNATAETDTLPEEWHLTDRQRDVLAFLILGLSNKMIARKLDIVESTVKIHVSAILRELKVATRTQALLEVARRGIKLPLH